MLGGLLAMFVFCSGSSFIQDVEADRPYNVLWISEFLVDREGIALHIGTRVGELKTVEDYEEVICRVLREVNLGDYRDYGIRKKDFRDYRHLRLNFYFDLNAYVPEITSPPDQEKVRQYWEHSLGYYIFSPTVSGRLTIYRKNKNPPNHLDHYDISHVSFCPVK